MGRVKFVSTKEAAAMIPDGARIGSVGFLMIGVPEEIWLETEKRFLETGSPKNISLLWASGPGDGRDVRGFNHLCHEGLLTKAVGGHYGLIPRMASMINNNKMQAYNFPQGVLATMFRDMAARKPGVVTHVGLGTFVDPEFGGGKLNSITTEDLVQKIELDGKPYLYYKCQEIDVAVVRGTEADENGNIGISKESLRLEGLSAAQAARNNGGIVIAQVERIVKNGTIDPRHVLIPGPLVDVVAVVSDKKNHMQTSGTDFNIEYISGAGVIKKEEKKDTPLDVRKVIGRRAAMELSDSMFVLNYGIGVPEQVAVVLKEEGLEDHFTSTVEPGIYGGTAQGGLDFGAAIAPQAVIDHPYQFDFYDGGGVDMTFLGMAECDPNGSLNVSKFGPKIAGCGGFIDISQNAKACVFCGIFTAGGLKVEISDGKLKILNEGKVKKFINKIEQITFNGEYESKKNKKIMLITERAVFEYRKEGLTLTEIAPGVELEKDVLSQMEFTPLLAEKIELMDERIFKSEPMGLTLK